MKFLKVVFQAVNGIVNAIEEFYKQSTSYNNEYYIFGKGYGAIYATLAFQQLLTVIFHFSLFKKIFWTIFSQNQKLHEILRFSQNFLIGMYSENSIFSERFLIPNFLSKYQIQTKCVILPVFTFAAKFKNVSDILRKC